MVLDGLLRLNFVGYSAGWTPFCVHSIKNNGKQIFLWFEILMFIDY